MGLGREDHAVGIYLGEWAMLQGEYVMMRGGIDNHVMRSCSNKGR